MTGQQFARAGFLLYGDQWHENLARTLKVDSRRIPQWESGKRDIPAGVVAEIIELLKSNSLAQIALIAELESN
ncbi:hypothetical protein SAMN05660772_02864 [Pasteurella testudinis DSM 23072]|uniref:Transcriptional regulator n=1 Tax=Pasteurella testudinis DSM 23072 TaxID=1122938 RepID=A0A1W1V8F4_9PAST|nr:hypothetical protein [Pasteurella testudinis]SMB89284.1 hypothetical protein SAMN05660772_02864 [Pasteurella testudinis DSM 23072]SUB51652.1 Uncharacterised protein [Pasteurella testudinis]